MHIWMSILIVLIGCFIISIVVFGGAQMFIPYFKILLVDFLKVNDNDWNSVLSIANATPGIFGLKVAFASGYLVANGEWWGFLLMFGTYIIFIIIPIIFILLIFNYYNKKKNSRFMISFSKMMKPIIGGILCSIILDLILSLFAPFYFKNDNFFINWRYIALLNWTIISIPVEFWIMRKWKISSIYVILINIVLCLLIFEPWVN